MQMKFLCLFLFFIYLFYCNLIIQLDEKQEPEGKPWEEKSTAVPKNEEEQLDNQHIQKPHLAREEQPDPEPFQSNVLQSDVQWGHKTLQKLLNSLRFR